MSWLFSTRYTWWHLLTLKVLLTAEIRKTWHVKAVVAASSSDCITWQAWKSLLDSVGCQNIGNLTRLTEEFVGRELKFFFDCWIKGRCFTARTSKLWTYSKAVYCNNGDVRPFVLREPFKLPLAHWLASRTSLPRELSYCTTSVSWHCDGISLSKLSGNPNMQNVNKGKSWQKKMPQPLANLFVIDFC